MEEIDILLLKLPDVLLEGALKLCVDALLVLHVPDVILELLLKVVDLEERSFQGALLLFDLLDDRQELEIGLLGRDFSVLRLLDLQLQIQDLVL